MALSRSAPEILAPAGDRASLEAAIAAGADAVYFGLHGYNARARATNFDETALEETVRLLHDHAVRAYVTLNTLIFDSELDGVAAAIRACAHAGVDAIIVQDLGLLRLARAIAPDLPVHASTQMTCTDAASVKLAGEAGASRVILAREMSLDDIRAIRSETDVPLEVFVHGALCVAYSGQCLTSEAIGGRSANRGACAQACRLPYDLIVDGEKRDTGDRAFLLSPEDLETSDLVPELIALGVASLKIEGRLKGPDYVAATTRLYRRAVDAAIGIADQPTEADRLTALQTFSRGSGPGFLRGANHQRLVDGETSDHRGVLVGESRGVALVRGRRYLSLSLSREISRGDGLLVQGGFGGEGEAGGRVWNIIDAGDDVDAADAGRDVLVWLGPEKVLSDIRAGRRVFRTSARDQDKIARQILSTSERRPLSIRVTGTFGEPPVFVAQLPGRAPVRVLSDTPLAHAATQPLTPAVVAEKLGQLGETPFRLGDLSLELPPGAMLPLSSLKRARRAIVEAVQAALHPAYGQGGGSFDELGWGVPLTAPPPAGLWVVCRTLPQAEAAVGAGADGVYLDFLELTGIGAAMRALRERGVKQVGVAPPRIRKPGEEKIDRYLDSLSPDAILVRSLGALRDGALADRLRIGDFSLNVTNRIAALEVLSRGVAAFTPSFDLDGAQLVALLGAGLAPFAEVVIHHPMPLFHMEHCVFAALLSGGADYRTCGRPCDRHTISLRDRAGMDHPVEADVGCRNTVFHAAAQSAAGMVPALQKAGVRRFRIELVRESADDTARIVGTYRRLLSGDENAENVWRQLRAEGGYGVVRGSLRVL